jgi:hypothetical protein
MAHIPHDTDPDTQDRAPITPELYEAAREAIALFAQTDQETITGITDLDALNVLLGNGALADSFSTVVLANTTHTPLVLGEVRADGETERRRIQITAFDEIIFGRTRFGGSEHPAEFIEEMVHLPLGPILSAHWGEDTAFAQKAETRDERTWAAYYPGVADGPNHPYMHYASDPRSFSGYAQCVQDMARDALRILPATDQAS